MVTDSISDSLIRIKNGYLAGKEFVDLPKGKTVLAVSRVLMENGYLEKVIANKTGLVATLKYHGKNEPALRDVRRLSKPSRRLYVPKDRIPRVLGGMGICLVSTPQGILTDKEARIKGLGGELICEVW